jgi:LysW-gamma-L-lysine carboxypeptidase
MSVVLKEERALAMAFDVVAFLQELVAIESYSGQEASAAEFLVDSMSLLGFQDAHVDEAGNAVGSRCRPDVQGKFQQHIVLLGHMDTVKGQIPVRIEQGNLYGRGSVDAKGPLATLVVAAAQARLSPGTRVTVVGAVEEESSTSRGARFAAQQYQPDFCIIGEPSGLVGITIGYKGILQINYLLEKPMGHASGMHSGVPEHAIEFWNRIRQYASSFNRDRDRLFDQLIPAIRDFHFDCDGLFDRVKLHASVRLPLDFDCAEFQRWLLALDHEAVVKTYGYETAYRCNRNTRLATAFNRVLRSLGKQPTFKVKTGTCDLNVVGPVWKCPIVAYGPGDSSLDHTPNEHIAIDEYVQAIDVLQKVLESL